MRNRHLAPVCRTCHAPMASGAGTCWRCGIEWATEPQPPVTLRLVAQVPPHADDFDVALPVTRRVAVAMGRG